MNKYELHLRKKTEQSRLLQESFRTQLEYLEVLDAKEGMLEVQRILFLKAYCGRETNSELDLRKGQWSISCPLDRF
jgi:hypothetical protein